MKQGSKLVLEFCDDGSVRINATGMIGSEAELLKDLGGLAKDLGGKLKVEKHVHSHSHSHSHDEKEKQKH